MDDSRERAHRAWRQAERVKRLSDGLVRIGPWGLGVDALIDWLPGAGPVYSASAAALLLYEAVQGGAKPLTIARMAAYLAADTATSSVPIVGWLVDAVFPGHLLAAGALQKDIEKRHGPATMPKRGFGFGPRTPAQGADDVIDMPAGSWRRK